MSAKSAEPLWYAQVPGFSRVDVMYCGWRHPGNVISIEYSGTAEDLIAAGVATAWMLVINGPTGPRAKRVDEDGDRFHVARSWRSTRDGEECAPYRWFRLTRTKPRHRFGTLPGALDAIAAFNRYERWRGKRYGAQAAEHAPAGPSLQLVVDNTRGIPS